MPAAAGGKRIRPVLLMECCRLCGGDPTAALPFAAAVEMVHSYSLVHDDLPCMVTALCAAVVPLPTRCMARPWRCWPGDGLLTLAFEVMLRPESCAGIAPENALSAALALAQGAGITGMVGGR